MAQGNREVGLDDVLFLAPGFLVSLSGAGIVVFPQLSGSSVRRAPRGAVTLVAALSRSEAEPVGTLIEHAVTETGADHAVLFRFVNALAAAGVAVPTPSPRRFASGTSVVRETLSPPGPGFALVKPAGFLAEDGAFLWFDHSGELLARLSPAELLAATSFGVARTLADARAAHSRARPRVDDSEFDGLVRTLLAAGLLRVCEPDELRPIEPDAGASANSPRAIVQERVAATIETHEREAVKRIGRRTTVVPVNTEHNVAPLSLASARRSRE